MFDWLLGKKKITKKPYVLVVMDGYGIAPASAGNAITQAKTPNIIYYQNTFLTTQLIASGEAVGLSANEKGNTEVGHLTIGAGRIVLQDLTRITADIDNGRFFFNPALLAAAGHTTKFNSKLHIIGLAGSGVTHSSLNHLLALIRFCKNESIKNIYLHLMTDGRDSPPKEALTILQKVESEMQVQGVGKVATISGRYWSMDRDNRWDRTEKAYKAMVAGLGVGVATPQEAVEKAYSQGLTDEFIEPSVVMQNGQPIGTIDDNDAVVFFNFRTDRPKQLTLSLCVPNFETLKSFNFGYDPETRRLKGEVKVGKTFDRGKIVKNMFLVTMTQYQKDIPVSAVAFPPQEEVNPLAVVLSANGKAQLHMAESEKEHFVKYYFNGLREIPLPGEDDVIVPSPNIKTYDLRPEMSLPKLTRELKRHLYKDKYDFIVVNFANPDMVAHSGKIPETIKAIEAVDKYLGEIVRIVYDAGGVTFITADHGNAEELINFSNASFFVTSGQGQVDTDHSNYPVPFIIVGKGFEKGRMEIRSGSLSDVAPTIIKVMGLPKPQEMTGNSLI